MKFSKIIGALCALYICVCLSFMTAYAKEISWDQKLEQVLVETETDTKLEALKSLLSDSTDPDQKIILNYHIGQTYIGMSHYGSAIEPLKTALSLNDVHTPDHHQRADVISTQLQTAYLKAGRISEGMAIANETVEKNDVLIEDMWSKNDTAIVHRFSALSCPHSLGALSRTEAHSFDTYARDIGCSYKEYRDEENLLTVYFSTYGDENLSSEAAHTSATKMMTNAGSSQNAALVYGAKTFDFKSPAAPKVLGTLFLRDEGREYTGTWTAVIEDWILKTRVTWDADLGEDFGEKASQKVFKQTPNLVATQIKACAEANWPEDGEAVTGSGIEFVMLEAMTTPSERPSLECLLGFSDKGNAFIAGHLSGPRLYTIAGTALNEDVFVEFGRDVNGLSDLTLSSEFILKSKQDAAKDRKASTTLYKAYKTRPGPDQVFQDFIDIYSGKSPGYGRVEFDPNGDTNIIINQMDETGDTSSGETGK